MIPYTRQLKMSDNYRTNFRDNGHTNKTCSLVSCRLPNAGANFEKIRGSGRKVVLWNVVEKT